MNSIEDILANTARDLGICNEGFERMKKASSKDELIDYYIECPDWCLERNFPDLQTLRDHFGGVTEKGVFVDKTFNGELLNNLQVYVFHNCKGTIKVGLNVDKAIISMLYLAKNCRPNTAGVGDIIPRMRTKVPLYIFGKNDFSAKDNKFVQFTIYKHNLL